MTSQSTWRGSGGARAQVQLVGQTFRLSPAAAHHMEKYLVNHGLIDYPVRIAVVPTRRMGGRGFDYSIVEDSPKASDIFVTTEGLQLVVDQESMRHFRGAQVDCEETLQGHGLVVRNPSAVGKCHGGRHDIFDSQGGAGAQAS